MTDEWEDDLQDLAEEYTPGYVITAFGVQESIKKEGYHGVHFTESTESYLRSQKMNVKNKIEKQINNELRKAGLK